MKAFHKKFFTIIMIIAFLMSTIPGYLLADNIEFSDVNENHWASPYIEKMALKGVIMGMGDGTFAPNNEITRAQSVTMLVRILGYSDDDIPNNKTISDSFESPELVPEWARKYVAVGVEEGIIAGNDLKDFRANDSAKRYEVAVMAVRALGLSDEADSKTTISLDFNDVAEIPMDARAYVEVAVENNIIQGMGDGSFKPMDEITRAQGAALFSRVDTLANKLTSREIKGELVNKNTTDLYSITVKEEVIGESIISVNNLTKLYREGSRVDLEDYVIGDYITVITNTYGTYALFAEASEKEGLGPLKPTHEYNVMIKDINSRTRLIVIVEDGEDTPYRVSSSAIITLNGENVSLEDLTYGQMARVEICEETNDILKITATGIEKEVEGRVDSILYGGNGFDPIIIVKDNDNETHTYIIDDEALITKDGEITILQNITSRDWVNVEIRDNKVVKIIGESGVKELRGKFIDISYEEDDREILIKIDDKTESHKIDEDVLVRRDGNRANLSDIREGDDIRVTLTYRIATEIHAEGIRRDVEGTITSISIGDRNRLTIINEDNIEETFILDSNARIRYDGDDISISELTLGIKGNYVELRLDSNVITRMDMESEAREGELRGQVINIYPDAELIIVSFEVEVEGQKVTTQRSVHYDEDTHLIKGNDSIRTSRLGINMDRGDTITVFGRYTEDGDFVANLIKW